MEVKRIGAGTLSSIAACSVQRPSPESEPRPANSVSSGSTCSAAAVQPARSDPGSLARYIPALLQGRARGTERETQHRCRPLPLPRARATCGNGERVLAAPARRPPSRHSRPCALPALLARASTFGVHTRPQYPRSDRLSVAEELVILVVAALPAAPAQYRTPRGSRQPTPRDGSGPLRASVELLTLLAAVIALVFLGFSINRLAGVPYPLWSPPSSLAELRGLQLPAPASRADALRISSVDAVRETPRMA
jgi:hypothetical protein